MCDFQIFESVCREAFSYIMFYKVHILYLENNNLNFWAKQKKKYVNKGKLMLLEKYVQAKSQIKFQILRTQKKCKMYEKKLLLCNNEMFYKRLLLRLLKQKTQSLKYYKKDLASFRKLKLKIMKI